MNSPLEIQVGGDHYKNAPLQHVQFCERIRLGWCASCVLKYVFRHRKKNKFQDLEKAHHYLILMAEEQFKDRTDNPTMFAHWKETGFKPPNVQLLEPREAPVCQFVSCNGIEGIPAIIMNMVVSADRTRNGHGKALLMMETQRNIHALMILEYPEEYEKFLTLGH